MKQVLIKNGEVIVDEVPTPQVQDGCVLVRVKYSLISSGTELSGLASSGESLLTRAKKQPEQVKKVIEQIKTQGLLETLEKVKRKLDEAKPSGYSCSGVVVGIGKGVDEIKIGDFVACAGNAYHAEYVNVPKNLIVKIPINCSLVDASSVAIGSIALQGVRRADNRIGEFVAVFGVGLIGMLTVQLLKVAGCYVIAIDLEDIKLNKALELGADYVINSNSEDIIRKISTLTNFRGVDSVIITASSPSSEIVQRSMEIVRKKGKVVVVGNVGMDLKRKPFYEKEADFLISCSYGPGRYDEEYEEKGIDYPFAYVRWTENRNMRAYLQLLADNKINFNRLISQIFELDKAPDAFKYLSENRNAIACILQYSDSVQSVYPNQINKIDIKLSSFTGKDKIRVAVIGSGNFALNTHLPNIVKLSSLYHLKAVVTREGHKAKEIARQFGAEYCTTDYMQVLNDENVDMVIISTRHNLHAKIAIDSALSGKAILLEKPMAMNKEELERLTKVLIETKVPFMVGFNRRFSKFSIELKQLIRNRKSPLVISYRVNAGMVPLNHWTRSEEGGGRIIGEACHMIDLINFFTNSEVLSVKTSSISHPSSALFSKDNFISIIKYTDGSIASLIYTSQGSDKLSKELIEVFCEGEVYIIDDFKSFTSYRKKIKKESSRKIEKGYLEELREFGLHILKGSNLSCNLFDFINATNLSFIIDSQVNDNNLI